MTTHRGTSNRNARGNTKDREARKKWLMKAYQAGTSGPCKTDMPGYCRCYRCGEYLSDLTVTVDRIVPGAKGGKYTRNNIRPACATCNSVTGATVRR